MNKNNKLIFCAIGIINFLATLALCIFALPEKMPLLIDLHEVILYQTSKWIMLIFSIIPLILTIIIIVSKNKKSQFFAKMMILNLF